MRQTSVATERGCPVCGQRVDVVGGLFVRHRIRSEPGAEECWGSYKTGEVGLFRVGYRDGGQVLIPLGQPKEVR